MSEGPRVLPYRIPDLQYKDPIAFYLRKGSDKKNTVPPFFLDFQSDKISELRYFFFVLVKSIICGKNS
jgi:hypothetical protein